MAFPPTVVESQTDRTEHEHRVISMTPGALTGAKRAYVTRRVDLGRAVQLRIDGAPSSGDLLLARVDAVGQHQRIELPDGRRSPLSEGDRIIVAYGARYAPDQFEAVVPDSLGPCSLAAAGGIAGLVVAAHAGMQPPTALEPIGLLADDSGRVLNVADAALGMARTTKRTPVIGVIGAAMNAGKTTTAAKLVRGLAMGAVPVGALKVTGTGAGGDVFAFRDHGAHTAYDFTDFGHATTAGADVEAIAEVLRRGIARLSADGCEAVVVEIADGVLQADTAALIGHRAFAELVDAVLFAAPDALSALAGLEWLKARGIRPLAISGALTASPLATRELRGATDCPVWDSVTLADPAHAKAVLGAVRRRAGR